VVIKNIFYEVQLFFNNLIRFSYQFNITYYTLLKIQPLVPPIVVLLIDLEKRNCKVNYYVNIALYSPISLVQA